MSIRLILSVFFIGIILFSGCARPIPGCISGNMEQIELRWGDYVMASGNIQGYMLTSDAMLYKINKKSNNSELQKQQMQYIEAEKYCKILNDSRQLLLKTQATMAPGDTSNYIEFINPEINVHIIAVWNPNFDNPGNRELKNLFLELQSIIEEEK